MPRMLEEDLSDLSSQFPGRSYQFKVLNSVLSHVSLSFVTFDLERSQLPELTLLGL